MSEYVMDYDGWASGIPVGEYLKLRDVMHERRREEIVRCMDCKCSIESPAWPGAMECWYIGRGVEPDQTWLRACRRSARFLHAPS